jgi:hypothetical protein
MKTLQVSCLGLGGDQGLDGPFALPDGTVAAESRVSF